MLKSFTDLLGILIWKYWISFLGAQISVLVFKYFFNRHNLLHFKMNKKPIIANKAYNTLQEQVNCYVSFYLIFFL